MKWLGLAGCVFAACLGLSGCGSGPEPQPLKADLIFVGRIVSSEPTLVALIFDGNPPDIFADGQVRTFEALDQPGIPIIGVDQGRCAEGDLGDRALLVFLKKNFPPGKRYGGRPYFVEACLVVDANTASQLRRLQVR